MPKPTVVILAAGENSRFFPLNQTTHKGALTLLGKPIIVRTLENLAKHGFEDVVIVVSPRDADGKGFSGFLKTQDLPMRIQYVVQTEPKGMGDAVLLARDHIEKHFAVIFPSSIDAGEELERIIDHAGNGGAIVVSPTDEPWLYGIVTLSGRKITGIVEKPDKGTEPSNLKAQGMYYLSHEFLAFLQETPPAQYSFEAALDKFLQVFDVHAVEEAHTLPSLKYPWHLFEFQQLLFSQLPSYISPMASVAETAVLDHSNGSIYIENGAHIGHATRIVGPCYIGRDVRIGDFSLIRASSFETGSSVGVHSDVTRSLIMEGSSMHNGFLGDSIIGRDVTIGSGFITSNKRMDRQPIEIVVKNEKIATGREGLGTVVGDEAKIGIRVNVMPGKFIGCRSVIYPAVTIWEHVPHDTQVKHTMNIQMQGK